jgi:hypothetical protein
LIFSSIFSSFCLIFILFIILFNPTLNEFLFISFDCHDFQSISRYLII